MRVVGTHSSGTNGSSPEDETNTSPTADRCGTDTSGLCTTNRRRSRGNSGHPNREEASVAHQHKRDASSTLGGAGKQAPGLVVGQHNGTLAVREIGLDRMFPDSSATSGIDSGNVCVPQHTPHKETCAGSIKSGCGPSLETTEQMDNFPAINTRDNRQSGTAGNRQVWTPGEHKRGRPFCCGLEEKRRTALPQIASYPSHGRAGDRVGRGGGDRRAASCLSKLGRGRNTLMAGDELGLKSLESIVRDLDSQAGTGGSLVDGDTSGDKLAAEICNIIDNIRCTDAARALSSEVRGRRLKLAERPLRNASRTHKGSK